MKRCIIVLSLCIAVSAVLFRARVRDAYVEWSKPPVPSEQPRSTPTVSPATFAAVSVRPVTRTATPKPSPTDTPVNGGINLAVPFSSQAPSGDWSLPWQEACEETSALLVDAYWRDASFTIEQMESSIQALVAWQQSVFGYYKHTTAAQTARILREALGYKRVDVIYDAGIGELTEQVRAGRPVIVPLAGRLLGNPYYTSPGPVYHMLVVKGIADNGDIITNDVGTRHGRNLTYTPDVFLNAMHDVPAGGDEWPVGVDPVPYIESGRRAIIVVYPNE